MVTPLKDVSAEYTVFLGEIIDDDDWLSCVSIPPLVWELNKGMRAKAARIGGFAGTRRSNEPEVVECGDASKRLNSELKKVR